jgi:chromosome segregation ATPase
VVETPLSKLARLFGGVALMQGRFEHQVLGQLLIAGTNELAVAGAAVVVAGTAQKRDSAAHVALRTAAPAIALYSIFERREQILRRREHAVFKQAREVAWHDYDLELRNGVLERRNAKLSQENTDLEQRNRDLESTNTTLNNSYSDLDAENKNLHDERDALADTLTRVRSEMVALSQGAPLGQTYRLAMEGLDAYAETVKRLRRHKDTLRKANALCVFERSILRNRNEQLRQQLTELTEKLRAFDAPAAEAAAEPAPPAKKKRAKRRQQQRRAKKRTKKPE